jgi:tetratricopeptide (TPR) repeat protein
MRRAAPTLLVLCGIVCALSFGQGTPALIGRVQEMIRRGELPAARAELAAQLRQHQADPVLFNLLGVVEAQAGNYRDAEVSFEKAIRLAPRSTGIYLNLGRLYQENASKDPAAVRKGIETYRAMLKIAPNDGEANFQIARLLAFEGAYVESRGHLAKLPPSDLDLPPALGVLCAVYAGTGEAERARDASARLLRHPDLSEADVTSMSAAIGRAGGVEFETALLEGLAVRKLASAATLARLAGLYEGQDRLPKARETLEAAAQAAGTATLDGLLALARVSYKQGDFQGTLGYLAHARDLAPKNAGIHFFFGMTAVELNLPVEAEKSLREAIELDGSNPYYQYAMGAVKAQLNQWGQAIPLMQKYCDAKPDDPRGKLSLAVAYFRSGDDELALRNLNEVADKPATAPVARYYLGRIALHQGERDGARRQFERALAANPKYAEPYADLGLLHIEDMEYAKAEQALVRALELDPESHRANLHLLRLYLATRDPRADQQAKRVQEISDKRAENARLLLRTIEVRPY